MPIATRLGQRLLTHQLKESLERHQAVIEALDRQVFEGLAIDFDHQLLAERIDMKNEQSAPQPSTDLIIMLVDLDGAVSSDAPFEALAMHGP